MEKRLQDRVAIVTGGGSGIGRATAELFAQHGAKVVVADFKPDGARAVAESLRADGHEAIFVQVDVSDSAQVRQMVDVALETYQRIDILFNGAGALAPGNALDIDEQTWNRIIAVNLTGTFLCSKAALKPMIERGGGSIINVSSSTGAHDAIGNLVAYVASKGGVTMLTKSMGIDHAREGVRVNAIAPGPTDTPMARQFFDDDGMKTLGDTLPIGRVGQPQELASVALFLASDESSFLTGSIIVADGGQTAAV
jgi:NAD(P)-dependent dehydrogenase (short-subunit alcohol dehydrogenase family)